MSVFHDSQDYTTGKQILVFPDHYVCVARTFAKGDAAATTTTDGRKVIKAGTVYPANDATAIGVVFNDVDVTNGDAAGAVLIHGFVKTSALPAAPAAAAKTALKMIEFMPKA